jgi:hypothetical protein
MRNERWPSVIIRNRYWLLAVTLVSFMLSVAWNERNRPLFHSTVVIYVDEPPMSPELMASMGQMPNNGIRRLFHEARSTGIIDHLVERFDLGRHYAIPKSTTYRRERIAQRLHARMDVRTLDQNSLAITVKDGDRDMAARLANAVYTELVKRNEARSTADLRRNKRLYDQMMKDMSKRVRQDEQRMRSLLDSAMAAQIASGGSGAPWLDLLSLATRMGATGQEMAFARRADQIGAALTQKVPMTRLVLIRKATRDLSTVPLLEVFLKVLLMTLAPVILAVVLMLAWREHGPPLLAELRTLVDTRNDEGEVPAPACHAENGTAIRRNGSAASRHFPLMTFEDAKEGRPEKVGDLDVIEEVVEQAVHQVGHNGNGRGMVCPPWKPFGVQGKKPLSGTKDEHHDQQPPKPAQQAVLGERQEVL